MSTLLKNSSPRSRFFATAVLLLSSGHVAADAQQLVGRAYDLDYGNLLYTEHHEQQFKGKQLSTHNVEYRDPAGTVIATKVLQYDAQQSTPTFELKELRHGLLEGAKIADGQYTLYYRESANASIEAGSIKRTSNTVVDAGFDRFVSENFDKLLSGETQEIQFGVPGRQKAYAFKLTDLQQTQLFGRPALSLRIKPSSYVLRLLVDPIELVYDIKTKRLLRYRGRSNICAPNGKRYDARIDFSPAENKDIFG